MTAHELSTVVLWFLVIHLMLAVAALAVPHIPTPDPPPLTVVAETALELS